MVLKQLYRDNRKIMQKSLLSRKKWRHSPAEVSSMMFHFCFKKAIN